MSKELLPLLMQAIADQERSQSRCDSLLAQTRDARIQGLIAGIKEDDLRRLDSLRSIVSSLAPEPAPAAPAAPVTPGRAAPRAKPPNHAGRPTASRFAADRALRR